MTLILALSLVVLLGAPAAATPPVLPATPVPLPGGAAGIGFDDMGYSAALKQVLVPAGRTGNLDLVDAETGEVTAIGGFAASEKFAGGHGEGATSVDEGRGMLFVTDRTSASLVVVDPVGKRVVARAPLAGGSDYVRYVEPTGEVWVTDPGKERIEVFTLPAAGAGSTAMTPAHASFIPVPGGPEALVIDAARGRAYTHLWKGSTVVIDLRRREVVRTWTNGCEGSRGMALDAARGFLLVGCAEGKAVTLGLDKDGAILDSQSFGAGVDIISYNPELRHLYFPGGRSANLAIFGVRSTGMLELLGTAQTAGRAHCVASDGRRRVWVCDPDHGRILRIDDTLARAGD